MRFMKTGLLVIVCGVLLAGSALADNWTDAQKEVWAVEQQMWKLSQSKDADAFLKIVHHDYVGWWYGSPVPGGRESTEKWIRYQWGSSESTTEMYDLAPLEIVVSGDMAICFYYYFTVVKDKEGKKKNRQGRWVDVFKKEGDKWMLIGDHGGSTEDNDD